MTQLRAVTGVLAVLMHTVLHTCLGAGGTLRLPPEHVDLSSPYWSAGLVLEAAYQPDCSAIVIHDANNLPSTDFVSFEQLWAPWGVGVFKVVADINDANMTTQTQLTLVVEQAQRLRQVSWCVTVVVVSDNEDFLTTFAECSLKGRLLVWSTRFLAVTRLPLLQVHQLLSTHWTFSMMNAMLVVLNETLSLPSFYGAAVNVTALPYRPFWSEDEEQSGDNTGATRYSGSDAMMLRTIADALNFTFNVLPVSTWDQVTGLVMERSSFIASIIYIILPQRRLLYDFTYIYLLDSTCFSVATPSLTSNWESLFKPLADEVWISILVILLLVPPCLFLISRSEEGGMSKNKLTIEDSVEIAVGTLLGQGTKKQLPESSSSRLLLVTWLVFAFIVGNVYRGNLTAALTLPKYPPRPETLEQLVKFVDKLTMPDYGEFKQFFKQSDSAVYQELSNMIEIVPSGEYGLRQAAEHKQAYMDGYNYLQQMIADYYTLVDGSTKLYIGRESIIPGPGAWPIPHDAPYKPQLDKLIMYIIEGGLYEKWIKDMILRAKAESRRRQHEEHVTELVVAVQSEPDTRGNQALTLHHMQGLLMIVAIGLSSSMIVFIVELLLKLCIKETP